MKRIARFEKVSYENFRESYEKVLDSCPDEKELKEMYEALPLPRRATKGSAGYDFFAPAAVRLLPGSGIKLPTGIRVRIDEGWVLKLYPRSSLGFKYRLQLDNTVGIIDSDYYFSDNEGHIFIKLTNDSRQEKEILIEKGTAFAQGIFQEYGITFDDMVQEERNGGFGSTDVGTLRHEVSVERHADAVTFRT